MENIYEKLGLKRVINASGRITHYGVSTISNEVGKSMVEAAQNYVVMDDLLDACGKIVSKYTGGEDACITPNTSAAICLSCAAIMTGVDRKKIEQIPDTKGMKNEFIIQLGHCVDYGEPIETVIRTAGGKVVHVGYANKTENWMVEGAINENTAALIYVVSHHCVQKSMCALKDYIEIAHRHNLPVLMDCSAEEDITRYVSYGADLVCYSGAKAICGPTSGFVTGKKNLIDAVKLQYKGFGRIMKIGKENMVGLAKAVEIYAQRNEEKVAIDNEKKVEHLIDLLEDIKCIETSKTYDEAGRAICRCAVKILPNSPKSASEVVAELQSGNPGIYTRNHYLNMGIINFDPRPLIDGDEELIAKRLKEILE